jgi:hypothetical protein
VLKLITIGSLGSIDADFLKVVPFGGFEICKENFKGHICPQKMTKLFNHRKSMKILKNFERIEIDGKFRLSE